MDRQVILGWDVGGAHLKGARAEDGIITRAVQIACPLWLGLEELDRAIGEAESVLGQASLNAITMTGELCDTFATRKEGVGALAAAMVRLLSARKAIFYAGLFGFAGHAQVNEHADSIASANWHASAALAGKLGEALFIDIGSTTTDIIPIAAGRPANRGNTDADRLFHDGIIIHRHE